MTFNGWLFVSVIIGAGFGHQLCQVFSPRHRLTPVIINAQMQQGAIDRHTEDEIELLDVTLPQSSRSNVLPKRTKTHVLKSSAIASEAEQLFKEDT